MKWDNLPQILVNRDNFIRLGKAAVKYRRQRNIFRILAIIGWAALLFLLIKG